MIARYPMQSRGRSLALLFVCLGAVPQMVRAAEPSPADAARAMVECERKFYQTGQEKGTRAAFLAFLADDAIVFRPGPVNGKEVWRKRAETGLDLIWEPAFAEIARSADFGYTTGPAKWRASKTDEKFLGYGHFISIWKKQKDGAWKVVLDCGTENPAPTGKPEPLRIVIPDNAPQVKSANSRRKALPPQEAQQKFAETAKTNSVDAVLEAAAEEIRIYRDGSFPAVGKSAVGAFLKVKSGSASFERLGGDQSRSADLAYCYGKYSSTRSDGAESGHYFQIWQTDTVGVWKLVVDWQQARPPEKS